MLLFDLFRREARIDPRGVLFLSALAAASTTLILVVVNLASEEASKGEVSLRLVVLMVCGCLLLALSMTRVSVAVAEEVERIVERRRVHIFDDICKGDLRLVESIGRGRLYGAITQNLQVISRNLPMVVIGLQHAVMLVFVSAYLAWLSFLALGLFLGFAALAMLVHTQRLRAINRATEEVSHEESHLVERLRDILDGFKEVRMSHARAAALIEEAVIVSDKVRTAKTAVKGQWAREFAAIQLAFYLLIALMVFVVPLFTTEFHTVVMQATTTALFMIAPISSLIQTIPALNDGEAAMREIEVLRQALRHETERAQDETLEPLREPLRDIVLEDIAFTYGKGGRHDFRVGPLNARFEAGQITFITGGNGSGKSTFLHLLTALMPPESGTIRVNGAPLAPGQRQAYRDTISTVLSDYHLFRPLHGVPQPERKRVAEMLERMQLSDKVGIEDGAFTTIDLSQGQRKRLALIVAEMEDKPVLVLDEWAADQDPHFRAIFYETILPELKARGKIVICVTHDDRWFFVADQLLHMQDGKLNGAPAVA
ncbi:MAG: cyclic peptide export ABC transporter [Alphaproteobacteria bacterium]|nr:cyclic peptide export ABC transporter [Alphaproteobacteria bacterium]MBU0797206.1 cyclic peptide export ABC transporter [Alphaproteobacteria bacterium]MBU0887123.1 cyclic peptide export ABC transporter [Alphaproteobacteria bacterium]MBU1814373.1 cyclic peptide export ABC transporter [Alphaproteobacteria bacterium]